MAKGGSEPKKKRPPAAPPPPVVPAVPPKHVYRWDLDKTYLRTDFDTFKQLWRTAFEKAEEKSAVPGAAALLRELRAGGGVRICFISGSPRQMRRVLAKKLQLDGVQFDEFILKPNLRNMLTGRFRALKEQVGYKLPALLGGRAGLPKETPETCFGDDAEMDALVYSLYGDIISGNVDRGALEEILQRAGAYEDDIERALALADSLPKSPGALNRVFIRLDRHSPTARFDRYGARLVPIFNYFQAALILYETRALDHWAVVRVTLEMVDRFGYTAETLRNSLADLLRRGRLAKDTVLELGGLLQNPDQIPQLGTLRPTRQQLLSFGERLKEIVKITLPHPLPTGPIDYLAALRDLPKR
jgi:hypothetical protein